LRSVELFELVDTIWQYEVLPDVGVLDGDFIIHRPLPPPVSNNDQQNARVDASSGLSLGTPEPAGSEPLLDVPIQRIIGVLTSKQDSVRVAWI
jgi:hypothetical protein